MNRALADLNNEPGEGLYRACDPYTTKARAGDLLCYHRETYAPRDGQTLHRSLMRDIASGGRLISMTHCEIVVDVDRGRKKIITVGGNVQQSITERTLNMNRQGFLSTSYVAKACGMNDPNGVGRSASCNLNNQPWFVMLQAR